MNTVKVVQDKTAKLRDALRALQRDVVLVGIPEGKSSRKKDGAAIGNAAIGYIQENGSGANNIPPRPFLVPGVRAVADKCAELLAVGAGDMLDGGESAIRKAMNKAGLVAQASVKNTLVEGAGYEPLSPVTLQLRAWKKEGVHISGKTVGWAAFLVSKGLASYEGVSTKPLVVTGQLLNSITYVIRKRNG